MCCLSHSSDPVQRQRTGVPCRGRSLAEQLRSFRDCAEYGCEQRGLNTRDRRDQKAALLLSSAEERFGFRESGCLWSHLQPCHETCFGPKHAADAPVSYPHVWSTPYLDRVQWTSAASNKPPFGPLIRNVGEALGVFGELDLRRLGPRLRYSHSSISIKGLESLEAWLQELDTPAWPATLGGDWAIDKNRAAAGQVLYANNCAACHALWKKPANGSLFPRRRLRARDELPRRVRCDARTRRDQSGDRAGRVAQCRHASNRDHRRRQPRPRLEEHDAGGAAGRNPASRREGADPRRSDQAHSGAAAPRFRGRDERGPGPASLDVPEDVCHGEHDFDAADFWVDEGTLKAQARRTRPDPDELERAAKIIAKAERPLLLVGGGIHISEGYDALLALAENFGIPVAHTMSGKGAIPCTHPLSAGLFGRVD